MASAEHLIRFRSRPSPFRWFGPYRRVLGPLLVLVGVLGSARALAEPSDADRATARALANEGHDALVRRDYATAEDRFRRADALVHAPSLGVEHARALVGLGRRAAALRRYEGILREGVAPSAPLAWKRALKDAETELDQLKPELGWLSVRVEPKDALVVINQEPVPSAELNAARAVDPGQSVIQVTAPGYLEKEVRVDVTPGGTQEVSVKLDKREVPTESVVLEEPSPPHPPAPPPFKPADRTLAYVAFGIGAAGLATGITTGVIALGKKSDLENECQQVGCAQPPRERESQLRSERDSYHLFGTISGIGYGVGLAGAAAGLYLWLTSKPTGVAPASGGVRPYVGLGNAGLTGSF